MDGSQHTTTNLLYRFCEITLAALWEMVLFCRSKIAYNSVTFCGGQLLTVLTVEQHKFYFLIINILMSDVNTLCLVKIIFVHGSVTGRYILA